MTLGLQNNASVTLKQNPIESYPNIEKGSIKSLFFPIVFAFCFVVMLTGTKAVPTGETPSFGRSQNKACHGRPQLVRKSQYTLLIGIFLYIGLETNTPFSVLFLSDTLCSSKGKKGLCRTQDAMGTPMQVRFLYVAPFKFEIGLIHGIRPFLFTLF